MGTDWVSFFKEASGFVTAFFVAVIGFYAAWDRITTRRRFDLEQLQIAETAKKTEKDKLETARKEKERFDLQQEQLKIVADKAKVAAIKVDIVTEKANEVTIKAEESASAVTKKLEDIAKVGDKTHTLVNSSMGTQLKLNYSVSKRLADITGHKTDIEAATEAKKLLDDHNKAQAKVDKVDDEKSDSAKGNIK